METTQEERDEWADSPADMVRRLTRDANLAAAYERACVRRSEGAPEWAELFMKDDEGVCRWVNPYSGNGPAPDLRPDLEGPVTLPVVDA